MLSENEMVYLQETRWNILRILSKATAPVPYSGIIHELFDKFGMHVKKQMAIRHLNILIDAEYVRKVKPRKSLFNPLKPGRYVGFELTEKGRGIVSVIK